MPASENERTFEAGALPEPVVRAARGALRIWAWISGIATVFIAVQLIAGRPDGQPFRQGSPLSNPDFEWIYVVASWLLLGGCLAVAGRRGTTRAQLVTAGAILFVGLLYAGFMRERERYGDFDEAFKAAVDLQLGHHLGRRWLYPPLLAILLEPLVPLGLKAATQIALAANIVALLLFAFLVIRLLRRMGFTEPLASLLTALAFAVNTPLIRSLGYVQINLYTMVLILFTLLSAPARPLLSAAALAVAVHLKWSPIVLVVPFVLARDFRWVSAFAFWFVLIFGGTWAICGSGPFLDCIHNVRHIYEANGVAFRDNSFDSLVRGAALIQKWRLDSWPIRVAIGACKAAIAALSLALAWWATRRHWFSSSTKPEPAIDAAVPTLMMMVLLSPIFWEHHPIFVLFSFLALLARLSTAGQVVAWWAAFSLVFVIPTFDYFPFSYHRLAGMLIAYALLWQTRTLVGTGPLLDRANHYFARLFPMGDPSTGAR